MKKKIRLGGLCCANCAAKIEDKVSRVDGVDACNVNFITEKMIVEVESQELFESLKPAIEKLILKVEPDVEIAYL